MKPIIIHTRWFPPRGYSAITLTPFVFYNGETLPERTLRHETVHIYQQLFLLVIPFYVIYLFFWIIGLLRYRNQDRAYRSIPFERSAYRLEDRIGLRWNIMAFDWLRCLK